MSPEYEMGHCPVCLEGGGAEIASAEEIRGEIEWLWSFHLRRLRRDTPPRYLADRLAFTQEPPLRVARCPRCDTLFRSPRERRREVVEGYAEEPLDPSVLAALHETQLQSYREQAQRLTRVAGGPGRGVELGSYVGGFLAAARERGWRFDGLDVNPHAVDFTRNRGFRVDQATLQSRAPAEGMRAVAIWNCIDQLPDPRATVRAAREWLHPGGILAVRAPNGGFYAALRRLPGPLVAAGRALLAHNNLLGFPYLQGFTPRSLTGLLRSEGFEPLTVHGDALVPISDRWTRRWAAAEERVVKSALRALAPVSASPWFEVYARRMEPRS